MALHFERAEFERRLARARAALEAEGHGGVAALRTGEPVLPDRL